jgi:hypothetical protein
MGREPKLLVAVGKKGCGKSFTTKKMMYQYAQGNPVRGVPSRRVLILDVNDEFTEFQAIAPKDVGLFSVHPRIEIRRVRPFHDDGKKMTLDDIANTLFFILENYRNGMLLVEDINKYISDTMPNDLIGAICTNRHIGVDIMIHYQSIGRITSKVWQNLNIIRMHKITDYVKKHKHKFEDKFEYISIAEIIVNKRYEDGDKHFFLYIDVDDEKVYGAFSKSEFEQAVEIFIQNNYDNVIKPMLNARDAKGKNVYTPESAIIETKRKLMTHYKG